MKRLLWLSMPVLLVVTFVGAWTVSHTPGSSGDAKPVPASSDRLPSFVAAQGHIDIHNGVANMGPLQSGRIVSIAEENATVEEGAVLVQLDDELARQQL